MTPSPENDSAALTELARLIEAAEITHGRHVEVALVIWDTREGGLLYEQDGWLGGVLCSSAIWRDESAERVADFARICIGRAEERES